MMIPPLMGRSATPDILYPRPASAVMPHPVGPALPIQGSFKKGGRVPKKGVYLLHKDEHVIPKGKRKISSAKPEKLVSVAALRA